MGLDAAIREVSFSAVVDDFDYGTSRFLNTFEIIYWRNNRVLHEWMWNRYRFLGGMKEFNGVPLRLYKECMIDLINASRRPGRYRGMINAADTIVLEQGCLYREDAEAFYYNSWW
jgi:hypothetical protein